MKKAILSAFFVTINRRVNGGVLQLTLGLSIVICMLCASMILLVYLSTLIFLDHKIQDRLNSNAISGINYGMALHNTFSFNQPQHVDLFEDGVDSVLITKKTWGIFELIIARASQGRHFVTKSALISAYPNDNGKAIIYSPDNNAPLYLVGKTAITGTAYLSDRKLSTGYIDGKDYEGKTLITGQIKKSEATILPLDTTLIHQVKSFLKGESNNYIVNTTGKLPSNIFLPFQNDSVLYYFSTQSISLTDTLFGNCIIHSAMKVQVTATAKLSDIIIMAPVIDIDKNFEGSIQCFATHSITVNSESKLRYPSALMLVGEENDSTILIRSNAVVEGQVIIPGYDQSLASKGKFKIEKKGLLHGMAYINGTSDIQGSLWGHIMSRNFEAATGPYPYASHILDGELNAEKKSIHLPGSLLWANTNQRLIAKWLD